MPPFQVQNPRKKYGLFKYRGREWDELRKIILFSWWHPINSNRCEIYYTVDEVIEKVQQHGDRKYRNAVGAVSGLLTNFYIDGYIRALDENAGTLDVKLRPTAKGIKQLRKLHSGPLVEVNW